MFEVPESDIVGVKIDEGVVLGKKPIEYIRKTPDETSDAAAATSSEAESDKNGETTPANEEKSKAKTYA
jgi:hypothetical protein